MAKRTTEKVIAPVTPIIEAVPVVEAVPELDATEYDIGGVGLTKTFTKQQTTFIHRGSGQYLAVDVAAGVTLDLQGSTRRAVGVDGRYVDIVAPQ